LINLRKQTPELQADGNLRVSICDDNGALCYERGDVAVAFNPTDSALTMPLQIGEILFETGKAVTRGDVTEFAPQTAVVFRVKQR